MIGGASDVSVAAAVSSAGCDSAGAPPEDLRGAPDDRGRNGAGLVGVMGDGMIRLSHAGRPRAYVLPTRVVRLARACMRPWPSVTTHPPLLREECADGRGRERLGVGGVDGMHLRVSTMRGGRCLIGLSGGRRHNAHVAERLRRAYGDPGIYCFGSWTCAGGDHIATSTDRCSGRTGTKVSARACAGRSCREERSCNRGRVGRADARAEAAVVGGRRVQR